MSNRRLAPFAVAGMLWFGMANAAIADTSSTGPVPTVTQTANAVTVSLPGVGTLSFSVDATTGAVSDLVATADPAGGFTAGTPALVEEGVQIVFTSATGTPQVLHVEVEEEDGQLKVKAETETDAEATPTSTTPTSTTPTTDGELGAGHDSEHDGQPSATSTTEAEHDQEHTTTTQMTSTTPTSLDGGSDGASSGDAGNSDAGHSGSGEGSGSGGGQD